MELKQASKFWRVEDYEKEEKKKDKFYTPSTPVWFMNQQHQLFLGVIWNVNSQVPT